MITFQGFKPSGLEKIANAMGFQGEEKDFQKFLEENPDRQAEMLRYQDIARKMVEGGYVKKMSRGGDTRTVDESEIAKDFEKMHGGAPASHDVLWNTKKDFQDIARNAEAKFDGWFGFLEADGDYIK